MTAQYEGIVTKRIRLLEERVEKLEHALLLMVTWHHGQEEYVKAILGEAAVQHADVEHGYCSDIPLIKSKDEK